MGPAELWAIISKHVRRISQKTLDDPRFKGGHQHSIWMVLRLFLLCQFEGFSAGVLYERLGWDRTFRRRYGLANRLISYSQYKKRVKTSAFTLALFELLSYSAQSTLRQLGKQETEVVITDLTSIQGNRWKDDYGAWGADSSGFFYGYKLGLITSSHGVILGMALMKANWTEHTMQSRLLRMSRDVIQAAHGEVQVSYLLADSGFDGERTYKNARRMLNATALVPPRRKRDPKSKHAHVSLCRAKNQTPYRFEAQKLWDNPASKEIAKRRSEIERVNAQLKSAPFRVHEVPKRSKGVTRLTRVILGKLLVYNFALNVNALRAAPLRAIRGLVA
jgi:transposase